VKFDMVLHSCTAICSAKLTTYPTKFTIQPATIGISGTQL
jgi:hypothetical protein